MSKRSVVEADAGNRCPKKQRIDAPVLPFRRESDLISLTVSELKDLCRLHGLPVSGRKGELIARLVPSPAGPAQPASVQAASDSPAQSAAQHQPDETPRDAMHHLRSELRGKKSSELQRQARDLGIAQAELDALQDADDPRTAVIEAIIARTSSGVLPSSGQQTPSVKGNRIRDTVVAVVVNDAVDEECPVDPGSCARSEHLAGTRNKAIDHSALEASQEEFRLAQERFASLETSEQRRNAVSSLLAEARNAAGSSNAHLLCDLFLQCSAALSPPNPRGDFGRGVTSEAFEELRTIKRALIMCLESLDFTVGEARRRCQVALQRVSDLVSGVQFVDGAKGVQQWKRIQELVGKSHGVNGVEGNRVRDAVAPAIAKADADDECSVEAEWRASSETVANAGNQVADQSALEASQEEFRLAQARFSRLETSEQRRDAVTALLADARNAAGSSNTHLLCDLFLQCSAALAPPNPRGDFGPGVISEAFEELRTIKRALIMCLESLDFAVGEAQRRCQFALRRVTDLVAGVQFVDGAKGVQQWKRIQELIGKTRGSGSVEVTGPVATRSGSLEPHHAVVNECAAFVGASGKIARLSQISIDVWDVPVAIRLLITRILSRLGEATVKEVIKTAWWEEDVWQGVDVESLNRYATMSWWTRGREPWENFVAKNIRHVCESTGRQKGGSPLWRLPKR